MNEAVTPTATTTQGQPSLRTGASFATISQFLTATSGGIVSIFAARTLGEQSFGVYTVLVAVSFITMVTATLGIETGLSYYLARRDWHPGNALRQVQLAAAVIGFSVVGLLLLLFPILHSSLFRNINFATLVFALIGLPFALSWTFSSFLALGIGRPHLYAAAPATQMALNLMLICILSIPLGLNGAVAALTGAHALTAVGFFVWLARRNLEQSTEWLVQAPHSLGKAVRFGIRANLTTALQLLNERGDLLILNAFVARSTLSSYAVAVAVTSVGFLIPRALAAVLVPRLAELQSSAKQKQSTSVVERSLRHIVVLMITTCLVLVGGLFLVPFVYGNTYTNALGLGLILVPGVALFGVASVLGATIVGHGKPHFPLFTALIVTPPTIAAYLLLVPHFGAIGAAITSTLSYSCTAVLTWRFFQHVIPGYKLGMLLPTRLELSDYAGLLRQAFHAVRLRR